MSDEPEVRIGTTEREAAQNELNEHFSQGRLEVAEFEERSSSVASARTRAELDTVFRDLPSSSAVSQPGATPAENTGHNWRYTVVGAAPFVAVILFFLLNGHFDNAWLVFLLVPLSAVVLGGGSHREGRNRDRRRKDPPRA